MILEFVYHDIYMVLWFMYNNVKCEECSSGISNPAPESYDPGDFSSNPATQNTPACDYHVTRNTLIIWFRCVRSAGR